MYIRYIHKLCDMHLQAENYTGEWEREAMLPGEDRLDGYAELAEKGSGLVSARC